jgi:hypothetical protein
MGFGGAILPDTGEAKRRDQKLFVPGESPTHQSKVRANIFGN